MEEWEERPRSSMGSVPQILDGICASGLGCLAVVSRSQWKRLVWKDDDLGFGAADFEVHVG